MEATHTLKSLVEDRGAREEPVSVSTEANKSGPAYPARASNRIRVKREFSEYKANDWITESRSLFKIAPTSLGGWGVGRFLTS